jgi:hypothetical protein
LVVPPQYESLIVNDPAAADEDEKVPVASSDALEPIGRPLMVILLFTTGRGGPLMVASAL